MKVGVHQGSILNPLLFIIVLEALSQEFCSEVPWEDLNADDLVIIAESLEDCVRSKEAMEKKGQSRCRKDKDHDLRYGTGPPAEFRQISMHPSVTLEWAATASSAMAASTGCTRNAVGSSS